MCGARLVSSSASPRSELLERRDPNLTERVHPPPPHLRDEAQVIVLPPLPRAALDPVADLTVLDRVRVRRRRIRNPLLEPPPHAPVVRVEVAHAVRNALARP